MLQNPQTRGFPHHNTHFVSNGADTLIITEWGWATPESRLSFKVTRTTTFSQSVFMNFIQSCDYPFNISTALNHRAGVYSFHCIFFLFFYFSLSIFLHVWMFVSSRQWCTLVTVKPTMLSFYIMSGWNLDNNLEMFYKHWLVHNENLSCLKYFVKKNQQCVSVNIYCCMLARFLNSLLRYVVLALNIQTFCTVDMSMKYFFYYKLYLTIYWIFIPLLDDKSWKKQFQCCSNNFDNGLKRKNLQKFLFVVVGLFCFPFLEVHTAAHGQSGTAGSCQRKMFTRVQQKKRRKKKCDQCDQCFNWAFTQKKYFETKTM